MGLDCLPTRYGFVVFASVLAVPEPYPRKSEGKLGGNKLFASQILKGRPWL